MGQLCRDCHSVTEAPARARRCGVCGSPRLLTHGELTTLSIAHIDCDAFYAAVEKREDPGLADRPVIIGGGKRGVVSTACYVARIRGVRSAMPMFQALKRCPDAVVIKPRMALYADVSRAIRARMDALTPLVEPLSLDEAFLDLSGTERLHGAPPAAILSRLIAEIEGEIGITASVGLSHNKFLAKIASDFDKPRGFSVIGRAETLDLLAPRPVGVIWGVGRRMQETLASDGIRTIADLRARDRAHLIKRYGTMGERLYHLSRGEDRRSVHREAGAKSISNETTFGEDVADLSALDGQLWRLAESVSARAKDKGVVGRTATLKLKTRDFSLMTRSKGLTPPSNRAAAIHRAAAPLLAREISAGPFRLIGIGISGLEPARPEADQGDMFANRDAESALDKIRNRFGGAAIIKGRALR